MAATRVLILGCGYTGKRVAALLSAQGIEVTATTRDRNSLAGLNVTAVEVDVLVPETLHRLDPFNSPEFAVLHSVPSVNGHDSTPALMNALPHVSRVVYISTTGVYGSQTDVDESSLPSAATPRELLRVHAEQSVGRARSSLILRPAAIYGPHRGIQSSMRLGKYQLGGEGRNFVSRIHVDDLATHCVAGLFSQVTGAWPVADEEPCEARQIAAFCAELLHLPMPAFVEASNLGETRRANRRVDGSAIRQALGINLRYPSYRVGIPAAVAAETLTRDF